MPECVICGGTEFYVEAGFYFCQECQTQTQDVREEILDVKYDATTRLRKLRIHSNKTNESQEPLGWTTWEQYNFILLGMVNEFVELGASIDIKLTILQLWAAYLKKLEVAFTSTKQQKVPKLAKKYNKRDAEIIYGKIAERKKKQRRRTGSHTSASSSVSGLQSEDNSTRMMNQQKKRMIAAEYERYVNESSEGEEASVMNQSLYSVQSSTGRSSNRSELRFRFNKAAKKESDKIRRMSMKLPRQIREKFRETYRRSVFCDGPQIMTPMQLWSLIYLALRIHDENIQLGDMLRWAREGHLSYYRLDNLLPPEVTLTRKEVNMLYQRGEIKHKGLRRSIGNLARFLDVWETKKPDLMTLIERYCTELQLPKGIASYAERMMALSPPRMLFNDKTTWFPNYEGRAMAFIVVVLKILFALDGVTEYEISRVVERINKNEQFFEMNKSCQCRTTDDTDNSSVDSSPVGILEPCVIVHGGIVANYSLNPVFVELVKACRISASLGYQKILSGGNSVDAVEAALWWLENDEFFNCGYGSVVNNRGFVEMDACLMNGTNFECGSVVAVRNIEHPISLARYVMENYPNTIIGPSGVERLAKMARIKSVSPENIISPASFFSNDTKYLPSVEYFVDDRGHNAGAGILKTNNLGAVGCIAWDGHSIVAGTSTGGTRGKMVGRVGDASFMGCGIFADEKSACCLTGHGESIIKMALARSIVHDLDNENYPPREVLKKHLDRAWENFGHPAGGIALNCRGASGIYCTHENIDPIPYAVVQFRSITFPSPMGDEIEEKYGDPQKEELCKAARAKGLTRSKLFSFCEWQRYIECRRNLLTNVHYPTKLKRASDTPGNSHLFLNYFNAIKARSSHREEPEITSYHHLMPRDLTDAMKNIFEKLDETASPAQKEVEIFPASLTPQYSYLQRMLEHPEKDLPSVLHANFRAMKIGYITEPKTLETLAAHCNINLRIVDAGLHFFDKVIPPYQQPRLPTIQEYNERVQIEQPIKTGTHSEAEVCNDLEEYLHRKGPFVLHIDPSKRDEYMGVFEASEKRRSNSMNNSFDFCFDEVLPNGKLLVINDESSRPVTAIETGNDFETGSNNEPHRIMDFLEKCNFRMSRFEKSTLITTLEGKSIQPRLRKPKPETRRDPSTGKFVRAEASVHEKAAEDTPFRKSNEKISSSMNKKLDEGEANEKDEPDDGKPMRCNGLDSSYNFGLIDDDISVLDETSSESSVENLGENDLPSEKDETETLFRPYTDYWLLRCIFSQTHQANFQDVLKMLPYNFRWLLEECSSIVEMSEEDLYEEIHLVESYFSDVLTPKQNPPASNSYERQEYRSRSHCNYIRKKW